MSKVDGAATTLERGIGAGTGWDDEPDTAAIPEDRIVQRGNETDPQTDRALGAKPPRPGKPARRPWVLALAGVGTVDDKASSFLRAGVLTLTDLAQLRRMGAVGETIGRFFDVNGSSDGIEINGRIIGIELDDLRRIPQVLAVARGIPKAASILGALRGKFLTVLATDDTTARAVLALDSDGSNGAR